MVSRVVDQQWYTETGTRAGPIILVQIENEFGNYGRVSGYIGHMHIY